MGLLIGASCITLIEILDLFFYNLVLKCLDAGYRKRAVAAVERPRDDTTDDTIKIDDLERYYYPKEFYDV